MKKFLSILIIILTLLLFISCAAESADKSIETTNFIDKSELTETSELRFKPNLPDINFEGYEFRVLVPVFYGITMTFDVPEEDGDLMNDAIYRRNRYVEEKYNVVIKQIDTDDNPSQVSETFKKSVMSGSDDFDMGAMVDWISTTRISEGCILPAEKLPYMDLDQPWYMRDVNDAYSLGNKHFLICSDESLTAYEMILPICFNKKLIDDLGLDDPYALVNGGKWTLDKFFDMGRAATADLNGDGVMTDADMYGFVSYPNLFFPDFWVSAGIQTVTKDADGMLVLNLDGNEKLLNLIEKIHRNLYGGEKIFFNAFKDKAETFSASATTGGERDISRLQFESDLGLFHPTTMSGIPPMRAMDTDFGIVPFPKADESQERYISALVNPWPKFVPSHAQNPERTSIIWEAIAAESRSTIVPAFKEMSLKTKFARDDESSEMIDLIFNNVFIDPGVNICLTVGGAIFNEMAGNGNITSVIASNTARFQKELDTINEAVMNLE